MNDFDEGDYLANVTGDQVVTAVRGSNAKQRIVLMSGHRPYPPIGEADFFIRKPCTADVIRDAIARFAEPA